MKGKSVLAAVCLVAFFGSYVFEPETLLGCENHPRALLLRWADAPGRQGVTGFTLNLNHRPALTAWSALDRPSVTLGEEDAIRDESPEGSGSRFGLETASLALASLPLIHTLFPSRFRDMGFPAPDFNRGPWALGSLAVLIGIIVLIVVITHPHKRKSGNVVQKLVRDDTKKQPLIIGDGEAGLVAYGTLMAKSSLEETLKHSYAGRSYQVHVWDFVRAWALRIPFNSPATPPEARISPSYLAGDRRVPFDGTVSLNVYPEKDARMNGVLYVLSGDDLAKVDARERGYQRTDITGKLEEYAVSGGRVYIYEGLPEPPEAAGADSGRYILIREYIDVVTAACDALGMEFRTEFFRSTRPLAYAVVSMGKIAWKRP